MNSLIRKMILTTIMFFGFLSYSQGKANGGIICISEIKNTLNQLAKEEPQTQSFNIQDFESLSEVYNALASGPTQILQRQTTADFTLSYQGSSSNSQPTLLVNPSVCERLKKGDYNLKSNLKSFISRLKKCENHFKRILKILSKNASLSNEISNLIYGEFISSEDINSSKLEIFQRGSHKQIYIIYYNPLLCPMNFDKQAEDDLKHLLEEQINQNLDNSL